MKRLFLSGLAVLVGSVGLLGFAGQAKADPLSDCWTLAYDQTYTSGFMRVSSICYGIERDMATRARATPPAAPSNSYRLDADANVRSGASGTSGVMFNTSRSSTVTVHSWDGDWAWITTSNGTNGWSHRVNLTKI